MLQATIKPHEAAVHLCEHTAVILKMQAAKLNLRWCCEYSIPQLTAACKRITDNFAVTEYFNQDIQRELIRDPDFALWLRQLSDLADHSEENGVSRPSLSWNTIRSKLPELLNTCYANECCITTYSPDDVLAAMRQFEFAGEAMLAYLENYAPLDFSSENGKRLADNLSTCCGLPLVLIEAQKALLAEPFISDRALFASESFIEISELFSLYPDLEEITLLLYQNQIKEDLTLQDYQYFAEDAPEYKRLLALVIQRLGTTAAEKFIRHWQKNNCSFTELRRMENRARAARAQDWDEVLASYSGYVDLLYGNRFKSFHLSAVSGVRENILIYAIIHNKKSFIRLVDENEQLFANVPNQSILFLSRFYQEHFNLNELTEKDLADCSRLLQCHFSSKLFVPGRRYTFPELKLLCGATVNYVRLYLALCSEHVDYRIKVFRQLVKRDALRGITEENDLTILAGLLDQKPLHDWRREELGHITGLSIQDTVNLMLHLNKLSHLLPSIQNRTDAMLVLRSLEQLDQFDSMEALRGSLFSHDPDWLALADEMGLTSDFKTRYQVSITEFLCKNGAGIAQTYLNRLDSEYRTGFYRVVKAELMGQFSTLKYYKGDLERELGCAVPERVQAKWPQNLSAAANGIVVSERDDFFSTILLGTQPYRTCLSYRDGDYRHCLLACFDSNKKIFYAEKDGVVVGRASIRLTKCCINGTAKKSRASDKGFGFVDLENIAALRDEARDGERAILFLERPYISNAGPQDTAQTIALFIQLAREKASELGTMLILSPDYAGKSISGFVQTTLSIYISVSKAGEQYLDSLGGDASISNQGSYSENRFLVDQSADILAGASLQDEKRSLDHEISGIKRVVPTT